jgi:hypothetical protein
MVKVIRDQRTLWGETDAEEHLKARQFFLKAGFQICKLGTGSIYAGLQNFRSEGG